MSALSPFLYAKNSTIKNIATVPYLKKFLMFQRDKWETGGCRFNHLGPEYK